KFIPEPNERLRVLASCSAAYG
ncbi:MAG: hypothetical protein QOJ56_5586, partial [Mycobacterium sp.]|nr:hypothetical protein [Mycobacterium sp.]